MFKMVAIVCILIWPDDVMTSQLECNTFYENPPREFASLDICNEEAYNKLEKTVNGFQEMKVDFESLQVYCEPVVKN